MNRVLRVCLLTCFSVFIVTTGAIYDANAANKFSGTCSGATITKAGTSDVWCCSATATEQDFTRSDGYTRGYVDADGFVNCCLYIECPNGYLTEPYTFKHDWSPSSSYCEAYYESGTVAGGRGKRIFGAQTGGLKNYGCVKSGGTNYFKCTSPQQYRDTTDSLYSQYGEKFYDCTKCGYNSSSAGLPTTNYTSWSYTMGNATLGNRAYTDCRVYAYRTETGCQNNRVKDTYKQTASSYYSPGWTHLSYSDVVALPGYSTNTSTGKCPSCGTTGYSAGGSGATCKDCPYYTTGTSIIEGQPGFSSRFGCTDIFRGFDQNGNPVSQTTATGSSCVASASSGSDSSGLYGTGACSISGSWYGSVSILWNTGYCQKSFNNVGAEICQGVYHLTGNALGDCANNGGWLTGYYGATSVYKVDDNHTTVYFDDLKKAQDFVSDMGYGCVEWSYCGD